jgi:hypothetical protein
VDGKLLSYATLLADPCEGPLVAPEYGSSEHGYLSRFHSVEDITTNGSSDRTSGYVVWFPDYTGDVGNAISTTVTNGSLYFFGPTGGTASTRPVNTAANPLGQSSAVGSVQGSFRKDPAYDWMDNDSVQDARTVAACMQFMYTGTMSGASGRFGYLQGIPRDVILTGGNGDTPPSVNDMFRVASDVQRIPLDKI